MANVQKQFEKFHGNIHLTFDDSQPLREKRDIVIKKLHNQLEKGFTDKGETPPTFTVFNQGSYSLGTGTKPLKGDYDIDVAVVFDVNKDNYDNPVEVKRWVYDALGGHTTRVDVRGPCVTVFYQLNGEPTYHVDLAVYSSADQNTDGKTYLARGKLNSQEENRIWEVSNPKELKRLIRDRHEGENRDQFRRIIRYLKRWKDCKFASGGNVAPIGIGITVAALNWFTPRINRNLFTNKVTYHDLDALLDFVGRVLSNFGSVYHDGEWANRLEVWLPVEPGGDLFVKMTNTQMANFKEKLTSLRDALEEAKGMTDPAEACKLLRKHFGDDFPVPDKADTAQPRGRAIVSSSSSG